jgi:stage II sporulation protein R
VAAADKVTGIPQDAIRMRVLGHSDGDYDQRVKQAVWRRISAIVQPELAQTGSLSQTRATMKKLLPLLRLEIERELRAQRAPYGFRMQWGEALIPAKTWRGEPVPAGKYEALVVTLGSGAGKNWWCVLFPQLCELQDQNEHLPKPEAPRFWLVEVWQSIRLWFD